MKSRTALNTGSGDVELHVLGYRLTYQGQTVTSA